MSKRREFLTVSETARRLGVSRKTLETWIREGQAPRHLIIPSGRRRFLQEDLDRWLEQHYSE